VWSRSKGVWCSRLTRSANIWAPLCVFVCERGSENERVCELASERQRESERERERDADADVDARARARAHTHTRQGRFLEPSPPVFRELCHGKRENLLLRQITFNVSMRSTINTFVSMCDTMYITHTTHTHTHTTRGGGIKKSTHTHERERAHLNPHD
jgi:hypothetical protein